MEHIPEYIQTYQMVKPTTFAFDDNGKKIVDVKGKFQRTNIPMPALSDKDALVEIKGCSICRTDLGFFFEGVPTATKAPLTLGHEISGTVVAGNSDLIGKNVIVPSVLPCGQCPICQSGRGNRCLNQKMPGNSLSLYGGFSSHIPVPARDLSIIEHLKYPLSHYSVVADAVTTPYQAAKRAEVVKGDLVVVIGVTGGLGVYMAQVAKAFGAKQVIGIARDQAKLDRAKAYGVDYTLNSTDKSAKEVKKEFNTICKEADVKSNVGWKIFECSGHVEGQEIALALLSFVGKLVIIGFGMNVIKYNISKLMAFDAEIIGTWGCHPKYYKDVLKLVQGGQIIIEPFIEERPMSTIAEAFNDAYRQPPDKRIVLISDF